MGGAANADAINAALVAQAAQGPGSTQQGGEPSGSAFIPAPVTPSSQANVQPFAKNTYFGGVNPFRQAPSTMGAPSTTAQSSVLRIPGFQGVANPFYSAPQMNPMQPTQPAQPSQAQTLSSQYDAYRKANADKLAAAEAQRQASALEAQKAYETARGNDALRAEYEQKMAELQAQNQQLQAYQDSYNSNYNNYYYGKEGGIASLMGRK